jgi:hypothetical protein
MQTVLEKIECKAAEIIQNEATKLFYGIECDPDVEDNILQVIWLLNSTDCLTTAQICKLEGMVDTTCTEYNNCENLVVDCDEVVVSNITETINSIENLGIIKL